MCEIYFTTEEQTEFLTKRGYKISTIKCWRSENEYHNKVNFYDVDVIIAIQDDVDVSELIGTNHSHVENKHGIIEVFSSIYQKELKEKIKELLW